MWQGIPRPRYKASPYEKELYKAIDVKWQAKRVPGSFFGSHIFRNFAQLWDEWLTMDPGLANYLGGESFMSKSHGQSLMAFFRSRFQIEGIYFLDEPETALSPKSQVELLKLIDEMSQAGHAQFIIATHSPILLACPNARILNFVYWPARMHGF
jgi:predicted ATPase